MRKTRKLGLALCVNAAIVILELVALVLSLMKHGLGNFAFYTQDSNYLAAAASLLYCVYAAKKLRRGAEIPLWIHVFRYISVSCLMVTFFVVLFVLMTMAGENALFMLYGGSMLYQHTICPILAAASFFALEEYEPLPKREICKALVPTLAYALVAVILNIFRVMEGPYPFLPVYAQPWYMSVLWCAAILGIAGILAFGVLSLHNFIVKAKNKERLK